METLVESREYETGVIEIHQDLHPENPREEWDHAGTMCSDNRRFLREYAIEADCPPNLRQMALGIDGMALPMTRRQYGSWWAGKARSGDATDDPDAWIYMDSETARKEGFVHRDGRYAGKIDWKRVEACLRGEVEEYSHYCSGEVYGFVAKARGLDGELVEIHSVWGFYCEPEEIYEDAKGELPKADLNREFDLAEAMAA